MNTASNRQRTPEAFASISKIYPISPRFEIQKSIAIFGQPEIEIFPEIALIPGTNTADIAHPSPAALDPPDSKQGPNPDDQVLGKFGTDELNIFVFVVFTFLIGLAVASGKLISTGTYGLEKNIGFTILHFIEWTLAK